MGFTLEARKTWPPVKAVKVSQLNHIAPLLLEFVSRPTATLMGIKVKHPLIRIQSYDEFGSLETFLMKFQRMANYLQWDDEDTFHHLCREQEQWASSLGHRSSCDDS